jgi:hypothetical protein
MQQKVQPQPSEDALSSKEDIDEVAIKEGHDAMWSQRNVCITAVTHMMPAAALLRLGVNVTSSTTCPSPANQRTLWGPWTITASLKNVVFETMTAPTRLHVEGDDTLIATCHAISAHLTKLYPLGGTFDIHH